MKSNSTETKQRRKVAKPQKPFQGFPLHAHASGQWARKINGKLYYFGVWSDPDGALERHNQEYPYLKQGRVPPAIDVSDGCTVRQLCNDFLESKESKMNAGDLSTRSFADYFRTCEMLIDHFGKDRRVGDLQPNDFRDLRSKLAARYGVVSLRNVINKIRIVFSYAHANHLIDRPIRYGQNFDRPSAKALRKSRNEAGPKLFEREEILRMLDAADVQMKALILVGLNCGFGNTDVATLPEKAVDLKTGWVNFPRPKTEIPRRIPLWPESIAAVKDWLDARPDNPKEDAKGLVFYTMKQRRPWVRVRDNGGDDSKRFVPIDSLSSEVAKLLKRLGINGRRGLGYYTLRHVFETVAGESRDQVAVDACMGHVDSTMSANYRHRISDERLRDVVNVVRGWLVAKGGDV